MNTRAVLLAATAALLLGTQTWAQRAGQLGVGIVAGSPIGPTVKYWISDSLAVDAAFGYGGENEAVFYGDFLVNSLVARPGGGKLLVYAGAGPRVENEDQAEFGLRTALGMSYWLPKSPVELFAEIAPSIEFGEWRHDNELELDGGIGLRFYFGK